VSTDHRSVPLPALALVAVAAVALLSLGLAACGGGGGPESPFPDDLPSRTEVLDRAYGAEQLLPEMTFDPYAAPTESHGGESYAVECLPVLVAAERGERLASASTQTDAEGLADGVTLPETFTEQSRATQETPFFWDVAHLGTSGVGAPMQPMVVRVRVVRRDAFDTRKADGLTARGRTYREAAMRLPVAGSDTMPRGTPGAGYRDAEGLATLAQLDWWFMFRGVAGAALFDATSATDKEGPAHRLRYTQVQAGEPDQVYLCEAVYRIDEVTVTLTASFRLLAQYAGRASSLAR
jgi:hypothetical protein